MLSAGYQKNMRGNYMENKSYDWDSLLLCQQAVAESVKTAVSPNGETDLYFYCERACLNTYLEAGEEVDNEMIRSMIARTLPEFCANKCHHYQERLSAKHSLDDDTGSSQ